MAEHANKKVALVTAKTALNAFTVTLAYELKDTPIKVNAADPGFTATDMNDHRGHKTVEQGAEVIIQLATYQRVAQPAVTSTIKAFCPGDQIGS